jgi:hypothetical protein
MKLLFGCCKKQKIVPDCYFINNSHISINPLFVESEELYRPIIQYVKNPKTSLDNSNPSSLLEVLQDLDDYLDSFV